MALPAVSEVFKGSIDESLKKLVQPAAIVPASVLVLLNVGVLLPHLKDAGFPPATAFLALDDPWKLVALTGSVLLLGYILLNLTGSILRVATGELIALSQVGRALTWFERRRIEAVKKRAETDKALKAEDARLPPPAQAAPTRLGNVLAGANYSIEKRYGFDMAATWTHLQAVVAKEDETLSTSLDDAFTGLQVLVNLAAVVLLVGAEAAALSLSSDDPGAAVLAVAALPVAYGLYRSASAAARSYTDLVEVAVDFYRWKVGEKFGLKSSDDEEGDRTAWRKLTAFLMWDKIELPEVDLKGPLKLTTTTADGIVVKALAARVQAEPDVTASTGSLSATWNEEHVFLLTAKVPEECCDQQFDSQLIVSGGKDLSLLPVKPSVLVKGEAGDATVLPGGKAGDSLLVRAGINGAGSTDVQLVLKRKRFEFAIAAVTAGAGTIEPSAATKIDLGASSVTIPLKSSASKFPFIAEIVVKASWLGTMSCLMRLDGSPLKPKYIDGAWRSLASITKADSSFLVYLTQGEPPKADGKAA